MPTRATGVPAASSSMPRLSFSVFSFFSSLSLCIFEAVKNSFLASFSFLSSSIALSIFSAGLCVLKTSFNCRYWSTSVGVNLNSASFSRLSSSSSIKRLVFFIAIAVRFGTCSLAGTFKLFSIFFRAGYPIRRRNNIPCFVVGWGGMRGFIFLLLPPFLLIKY